MTLSDQEVFKLTESENELIRELAQYGYYHRWKPDVVINVNRESLPDRLVGYAVEKTSNTEILQMIIRGETPAGIDNEVTLDVNFISQWAETAKDHTGDCGIVAIAMLLNTFSNPITTDEAYKLCLPNKGVHDFTSIAEMIDVGRYFGIYFEIADFAQSPRDKIVGLIDSGKPFIPLINYSPLEALAHNNFHGGHFLVVVGYDGNRVVVHDPLYGLTGPAENGKYWAIPEPTFMEAWSTGNRLGNPDFKGLVTQVAVNHGVQDTLYEATVNNRFYASGLSVRDANNNFIRNIQNGGKVVVYEEVAEGYGGEFTNRVRISPVGFILEHIAYTINGESVLTRKQ